MLSSTRATQTMPNPTHSRALTCSPSTSTPTSSCSTGVTNWIRPTVTSGRRRAAAAKSSSGTAVTTPASTSRGVPGAVVEEGRLAARDEDAEHDDRDRGEHGGLGGQRVHGLQARADLLLGQAVEPERERQAERDPRQHPAGDREVDRGERADRRPRPTAAGRSRSPSTTTPSATVTIGLRK